jgi:hypothetical protein
MLRENEALPDARPASNISAWGSVASSGILTHQTKKSMAEECGMDCEGLYYNQF